MIVITAKKCFFLKDALKHGTTHRPPFIRIVSRLNYKPEGLKFTLASEKISDIQKLPSAPSFEDLCQQRALDIERQGRERFFLSYSGGIDSTLVLISFLKYWKEESLDRLTVLMNLQSVEENKNFFLQFSKRVRYESIFQNFSERIVKENACLITGEHGDQLFGSDLIGAAVRAHGDSSIHAPYPDIAIEVMQKFIGDRSASEKFFERVEPIVNECPFPVRTVHDFFWWYNFTMKWQYVKFRYLANKDWYQPKLTADRVHHFFDTPTFQKWSLENHDKKIGNEWASYKYLMKEIIYKYNGDQDYLKKEKVPSLPYTQAFMEYNNGFDACFNPLSKEEILSHVL